LIYKSIKIKINKLFRNFIILNLIKNLFIIEKAYVNKCFFFFKIFRLKKILEKKNFIKKQKIFKLLKRNQKFLKIKFIIKKKFKYNIKKKILLSFFNKYKKKKYITFLNYFTNLFILNFKLKKEFLIYWLRFYTYILKYLYANYERVLNICVNILNDQYKNFYSLINLNVIKKSKILFFFHFFYDNYKDRFLTKYKVFSYYNNIKNILKKFFYKKNYFNIFFFNLNKNKKLNKYNQLFFFSKNIIKIKLLINLKNLIFIIFLKFMLF
jgi:hypothetical protein